MALDTIPKQEGGKLKAVASGTLPSGQPVVVNSDGTVSVVAGSSVSQALGTATAFPASGNSNEAVVTYDSNSNKVVVAFIDNGQSNYGKAVVGTISGTSISFGTPVVFESASVSFLRASFDSNSNKVVFTYTDGGNSLRTTAVVGNVSGTSISFGTPVVVSSGTNGYWPDIAFDSNENKVVIVWTDLGSSDRGRARVGNVSGTSITFGTQTDFEPNSDSGEKPKIVFDPTSNKVVVFYSKTNDEKRACIGTVSGTSITFTSAQVDASVDWANRAVTIDPATGTMYISYNDINNSYYLTVVTATTDGSTITYGTPEVWSSTTNASGDCAFHEASGNVVLSSSESGGDFIVATESGGSFTFGSPVNFEPSVSVRNVALTYDSTSKQVVSAYARDNTTGLSIVFRPAYIDTNLTSENYIGMSGGAVRTGTSTQALGSAAVFESANANNIGSAYDSANNKVVVAYRDDGDSGKGKAVVGTVNTSDNSISFGTPVEFEAGDTEYVKAVFDANSGKIVISFKDNSNSGYGKAIVGTVSGTSISFGSAANFIAANSYNISPVYDSTNNKVVIMYTTLSSPRDGKAVVGTVSGTSISFGSASSFSGSNEAENIFASFDSTLGKVVVAYTQSENSGYAVVGTVSGTSISFGSPVNFNGGTNLATRISCAYDSTANRTVIFYRDQSNGAYDTAIVGTVSGTTISFGTKTVVTSQVNNWRAIAHDPNAGTNVLAVSTNYNFKVGTVDASDNSMTFSGATTFEGAAARHISALYDSTGQKIVLSYQDTGNSNYGTSKVVSLAAPIVIRGEVADGDTATIDIVGTVSSNQLSLTAGQQYYVQTDGTVGTTPADPSVLAGTAVSATKMVVKS